MLTNTSKRKIILIILVSFLLLIVFITILVKTLANTVSPQTSVIIDNIAPTIGSPKICEGVAPLVSCLAVPSVNLTANSIDSNAMIVNVTDLNGISDISSVNAVFYNYGISTVSATDDNNDHYSSSCVEISTVSSTEAVYRCPLALSYYTNSGTWDIYMKVVDKSNASVITGGSSNGFNEQSVNLLTSATFESNINFSSKALGFVSGTVDDITIGHFNQGNDLQVDFSINASGDLLCDAIGSIPVGNIKFDAVGSVGWTNAKYTLVATPSATIFADLNIPQRTNDVSASNNASGGYDSSYWSIKIPSTGIAGLCTTTITAVAQSG